MLSRTSSNSPAVWLLALVLSLQVGHLHAGEVLRARVGSYQDRYLVHVDMLIRDRPEKVYARLTDYEHLDQLSDSIIESQLLYKAPPHYRVRIITSGCVQGLFCQEIIQVQEVTELPNGYILVVVVPELSDLKYSRSLWYIRAEGEDTRVTYSAALVPDFWIPPLIGSYIFKTKLLEESLAIIQGLEQTAPGEPSQP